MTGDRRDDRPTTLAEHLAGALDRLADPVRPDSREEIEARVAELRERTRTR